MPSLRPQRIGFFLIVFIPLSLFVWQTQVRSQATSAVSLTPAGTWTPTTMFATAIATATLPPSATATPTETPTLTPSLTPTPSPSFTPVPPSPTTTATATATAVPSPVPVDRTCPDPAPSKPIYDRYYLSGTRWPQPDDTVTTPHFWLAKPLPGGGRLLINQTFPYGSDGSGRYLLHNGVDAAESLGTPVLAVADGTVVVAQSDMDALYGWRCDWYGHLVVIELDQKWLGQPVYALYGHVLNIEVEVGQPVRRGDPLAEVGVGGAARVPHLHFEVRVGANTFAATRNPILWIDPGETRGVIIGRLLDPEGRPWQGVGLSLFGGSEELENRNTWSYLDDPQHLIHPDEGWAENFVFADVRPGEYVVYTKLQDVEYRVPVQVVAGQVSVMEIITEAYKTPTPTPAATAVPTAVSEENGENVDE